MANAGKSAARPSYQLTMLGWSAHGGDFFRIDVRSPELSPLLHPDGCVQAEVEAGESGPKKLGGCVLDAYQIECIVNHLANHKKWLPKLRDKLERDRRELDGGAAGGGNIWKEVEVKKLMIGSGGKDLRYTLALKVGWDEEHQRWVEISKGAMVHFSAE